MAKKEKSKETLAADAYGWLQSAILDTATSINESPDDLWEDEATLVDLLGDHMFGIIPQEKKVAVLKELKKFLTHPAGQKALDSLIEGETAAPLS